LLLQLLLLLVSLDLFLVLVVQDLLGEDLLQDSVAVLHAFLIIDVAL